MSRLILLLAALMGLGVMAAKTAEAVQRQFIIFFGEGDRDRFDPKQWLVIPAGVDAVREAAQAHKEMGGAILLIGNDQNVGSPADALVRSRRRIEAVQDLLVQSGVRREVIRTKPCGSSNPLAGNAKDVSEPQNRYVTIDLLDSMREAVAGANAVCPSAARDAVQ